LTNAALLRALEVHNERAWFHVGKTTGSTRRRGQDFIALWKCSAVPHRGAHDAGSAEKLLFAERRSLL
jgi:hypothetical protein